jgi:hypothetical protein
VEELMLTFLRLPGATEDAFWAWLGENLAAVRERHRAGAAASALEGSMREHLGRRPAPPAAPAPPPRPEPKFKVGEKAFHRAHGEVVILAAQWNELLREWEYVVEARR